MSDRIENLRQVVEQATAAKPNTSLPNDSPGSAVTKAIPDKGGVK
jgi:hypothetical protein